MEQMDSRETILREGRTYFQKYGLKNFTLDSFSRSIDVPGKAFVSLFHNEKDFIAEVIRQQLKDDQERQDQLRAKARNAVEELLYLLKDGIESSKDVNPGYISDLITYYPEAWKIVQDYLENTSYQQVMGILNKGILEGNLRKDINMVIVTKVILGMINVLINPHIFPPDRFNTSEVYRCIYLYYFRGLCTTEAMSMVDSFFA